MGLLKIAVILLFTNSILLGQIDTSDVVYYKNEKSIKGSLKIIDEDDFRLLNYSKFGEKEIRLIIDSVEIIVDKQKKNGKTKIYEPITIDGELSFFEKVAKSGVFSAYESLSNKSIYYLNDGIKTIPFPTSNQGNRDFLTDRLNSITKIYDTNALRFENRSLQKFVNYLDNPTQIYPSSYGGLRLSYSTFNLIGIYDQQAIRFLVNDESRYSFNKISLNYSRLKTQNKKGSLISDIGIGFDIISSKDIFTTTYSVTVPESDRVSGITDFNFTRVNVNFGLKYYLIPSKNTVHIIFGANAGVLVSSNNSISTYLTDPEIEINSITISNTQSLSIEPSVGIGVDLAIGKGGFITPTFRLRGHHLLSQFVIGPELGLFINI